MDAPVFLAAMPRGPGLITSRPKTSISSTGCRGSRRCTDPSLTISRILRTRSLLSERISRGLRVRLRKPDRSPQVHPTSSRVSPLVPVGLAHSLCASLPATGDARVHPGNVLETSQSRGHRIPGPRDRWVGRPVPPRHSLLDPARYAFEPRHGHPSLQRKSPTVPPG